MLPRHSCVSFLFSPSNLPCPPHLRASQTFVPPALSGVPRLSPQILRASALTPNLFFSSAQCLPLPVTRHHTHPASKSHNPPQAPPPRSPSPAPLLPGSPHLSPCHSIQRPSLAPQGQRMKFRLQTCLSRTPISQPPLTFLASSVTCYIPILKQTSKTKQIYIHPD